MARHWLIKSEPATYAWDDLIKDGETIWDGVRNHRAANNLRAMQEGDQCFYYHSVKGKEIVGIAAVSESGLLDPTDGEGKWAAVKITPVRKIAVPVTLAAIKASDQLEGIELVRLSRLSVAELTPGEWDIICAMGEG